MSHHWGSVTPSLPTLVGFGLFVSSWTFSLSVQAQAVYRCDVNGRVAYSHEPCVGARVVDTTPTQGLDKSTGTSLKGRDVRKEELDRALNEALRPLSRMSHEEAKAFARRTKLSASAQAECKWLDATMPGQEQKVQEAAPTEKAEANLQLYESRKRFRELNC